MRLPYTLIKIVDISNNTIKNRYAIAKKIEKGYHMMTKDKKIIDTDRFYDDSLFIIPVKAVFKYNNEFVKLDTSKSNKSSVDLHELEIVDFCNYLITRNLLKRQREKLLYILVLLNALIVFKLYGK